MPKKTPPVRSEEEIRSLVFRYLYDRYHSGSSDWGKKTGAAVMHRQMCSELKGKHGLTTKEVQRARTYLIGEGWVERVERPRTFRTEGGTLRDQPATYFRITTAGVNKIEGKGEFAKPDQNGVSITTNGQSVVTVGDGNTIHARFDAAASALNELRAAVEAAADVKAADKEEVIELVDAVDDMLATRRPRPATISRLWTRLTELAAGTSIAANVATVWATISPLLLGAPV